MNATSEINEMYGVGNDVYRPLEPISQADFLLLKMLVKNKETNGVDGIDAKQCYDLSEKVANYVTDFSVMKKDLLSDDKLIDWGKTEGAKVVFDETSNLLEDANDAVGLIMNLKKGEGEVVNIWTEPLVRITLFCSELLLRNKDNSEILDPITNRVAGDDYEERYDVIVYDGLRSIFESCPSLLQKVRERISENIATQDKALEMALGILKRI
jgi:hypothetical protein